MTLLEIFEKVNLVTSLEQRRFFNYFEDTLNELKSLYDGFVFDSILTECSPLEEPGNTIKVSYTTYLKKGDVIDIYAENAKVGDSPQKGGIKRYIDNVDEDNGAITISGAESTFLKGFITFHNSYGKNMDFAPPKRLSDANIVLPLYHNAMVENILFLSGQNEIYKNEFLRKSKDAFLKYWNDKAKDRRIKRMRW